MRRQAFSWKAARARRSSAKGNAPISYGWASCAKNGLLCKMEESHERHPYRHAGASVGIRSRGDEQGTASLVAQLGIRPPAQLLAGSAAVPKSRGQLDREGGPGALARQLFFQH